MSLTRSFADFALSPAGDGRLVIYLGMCVVFGAVLMGELRRHMPALWLFLAAIAAFSALVLMHALPEQAVQTWPMPRFWSSMSKELFELCGQLLLLLSFTVYLLAQIREIVFRAESVARD